MSKQIYKHILVYLICAKSTISISTVSISTIILLIIVKT